MNSILKAQLQFLTKLKASGRSEFPFDDGTTVGEVRSYLLNQMSYLQDEFREIVETLPNPPTRLVNKPWRTGYQEVVDQKFVPTDEVKSEAIDFLCFSLNVCLACGITPENFEDEFFTVNRKVNDRLDIDY